MKIPFSPTQQKQIPQTSRREAHPQARGLPETLEPEPLTSERMTLTMRNALDTRVVTCWAKSGARAKAEAGEWVLSMQPSRQPRPGKASELPQKASYRNHPPVPEPQHGIAQEQAREAEESQNLVWRWEAA